MSAHSWGLLLATALLGAGLGVLIYREVAPSSTIPTELLKIQEDLAKQRKEIEATRAELIEEIRNQYHVEVRKVYVRAGARVDTLVEKPEVLARDLAELVQRVRTERIVGQTRTSSTVR